ncbi:hypothetical protein V6N11_034112 [Hibiscus sabdariffa]|uniref:Uncharacterized protein n=2 Tax=Hibiscus sabdariffa TaxID=183260 RepID=A0ABR2AQN1_9ROSI
MTWILLAARSTKVTPFRNTHAHKCNYIWVQHRLSSNQEARSSRFGLASHSSVVLDTSKNITTIVDENLDPNVSMLQVQHNANLADVQNPYGGKPLDPPSDSEPLPILSTVPLLQ